jgi:PAS domain S-box-containing protein
MARILVVDDRPLNRDLLKTILGYANHEVVEAEDGADALDLVRTRPFDLIISDIVMPTMDGVAFVQAIRADPRFDHINVIFYTATYRLHDARKMAESCGVLRVLPKPCEPEVIIATVNECLGVTAVCQSPLPIEDFPAVPADHNLVSYLKDLHQLNARITTIVAQGNELVGQGGLIERAAGAITGTLGNLERMTLRLSAILEASMDLDLERDPQALMALFCRQIRGVVTSRFAVLGIGENPEAPLTGLEVYGLPREQWQPFPDHPGFFRRLMREGKAQRASGPGWAPSQWDLPAGHPACGSLLAIPVSSPRCTYGWAYLADRIGADSFSEEDEKLASTLASHFAVAYENLRLMEDLQGQIRERIHAEEAGLRLNEIVESSPAAIISVGLDRRITNWSKGAEHLFGFSQAEVLGEPLAMLTPPEFEEQHAAAIAALERGTRLPAYETVRLRKNGTPVPVSIQMTTVQDTAHRIVGFSVIMHDIGERRTLEGALQKTATQLQTIFNNVDVVIWSYDPKGNQMLEFSPACEAIYGLPPQAFFERPQLMFEAVHPDDQALVALHRDDLYKGFPTLIEHRILRPDGSLRWVLAKANPQMDSSGQVIRIDGAVSDITESRRTKERMVQHERLAALGTLVGTVAHDIRNPLMVMTSSAELLATEIPDNDRCRRHLDLLGRASARIMTLVNDLLEFGRPKPLKLAPTPEHVLLREAIEACETAAARMNVRVDLQTGGHPGDLVLDPDRMHQVLCNILENAIQHSPPAGVVRIATSLQASSWTCTVADEGPGIAGGDLPNIFDPFFTKRPGGTGLGLSIAHSIVQQHGGELVAENRSSGGAVFTIQLPLIKAAADLRA